MSNHSAKSPAKGFDSCLQDAERGIEGSSVGVSSPKVFIIQIALYFVNKVKEIN